MRMRLRGWALVLGVMCAGAAGAQELAPAAVDASPRRALHDAPLRARLLDGSSAPGQVVSSTGEGLELREGNGALRLLSSREVASLQVRERAWGKGAGRALLAAGEAALRERGCADATLWTEERNERPRRFYEAAGWVTDGEVKARVWNGAPPRELRYRKAL